MMYLLLLGVLLSTPDFPVEWLQDKTVTLEDTVIDEPVTYTFQFRNLTNEPLVVYNVRVGCGCTATDWAEEPVAPGAIGSINVTYDATNAGVYQKYVRVFFEGHRGGHKLWMTGFVDEKP